MFRHEKSSKEISRPTYERHVSLWRINSESSVSEAFTSFHVYIQMAPGIFLNLILFCFVFGDKDT